jgi:hypothetical protein
VGYAISVIVPSTRGWPTLRRSIDPILEQLPGVNGQLIVADGSGREQPEYAKRDDVLWLRIPRGTSYGLRNAGYAAAQAPIVVMTEDHCASGPEWLASCLAASAEHPEAAVIMGSVENGTKDHAIDRSLFCISYAQWSPPLTQADAARQPSHANLVWRRWALDMTPPVDDRRFEFRRVDELRRLGKPIVVDDRLLVRHYQCDTVGRTTVLMFHNGRQIGGFRRHRMGVLDQLRMVVPLVFAGYRTARTVIWSRRKAETRDSALSAAPWIALLHAASAVGESLGYFAGPGNSGRRTH